MFVLLFAVCIQSQSRHIRCYYCYFFYRLIVEQMLKYSLVVRYAALQWRGEGITLTGDSAGCVDPGAWGLEVGGGCRGGAVVRRVQRVYL